MQSYKRLTLFLFTLSTFLFSPITLAYVKYTYTSDSLNWKNTYYGGHDYHIEPSGRDVKFEFSFEIDESILSTSSSTTLMLSDATLTPIMIPANVWPTYEYHSKVRGRVEINPDKTIKYWYILFDVNVETVEFGDAYNKLTNRIMTVNSFGGSNTCNCDLTQDRFNTVIQRKNDWAIANQMEYRYGNRSSFDNWTITHYVPEANGLALAAIGLLGLVAIRRQKSK